MGRHTLLAVWAAVIAGVMWPSVPAFANVRSEALYARGLIPFNSGQWDDAYHMFDQAVQADGADAVALYYRGLTQARRGQSAAAIQDFEQVIKLTPSLPHVALDLGIAYFDTGQYGPAKLWLARAHQQGSERLTAAFFLGLAMYRLGEDAAAQPYLKEAAADPELRAPARYYAGLASLRQGNTEAGRSDLAEVAREQPQSEVGQAAQRYAAGAEARQPPVPVEEAGRKPWSVFGEAGFQYDTNVNIGPSDSTLDIPSGKDDSRAVLAAGGDYTLLDTDVMSARAHYDFYQSIHFRLTEFDLQGHRIKLDIGSKPGAVSYGIAGTYDVYLLDYKTFFQEVLGTPWVAFAEGAQAATQLYYTARGRDFFRPPYNPGRDAINHALGLRQYVELGSAERVLGFGYQFDAEDTTSNGLMGRDFQYKGHQVDVGLSLPILSLVRVQLAYLFRLEDYQFPNSRAVDATGTTGFLFRRHDNEHQVALALAHDLTSNVALTLDYLGVINGSNIHSVINGSNIREFDYNRNIVSVGVRVTF